MVMMNLPHWDMETYFSGLESKEFQAAVEAVLLETSELEALVSSELTAEKEPVQAFEAVAPKLNGLMESLRLVNAYVHAFVTTNSRDEVAQARASELDPVLARLRKVSKTFTAWLGTVDVDALIAGSELARQHAHPIRKAKIAATHLMGAGEEALASDLELTGMVAWGKLHGNLSSQLQVRVGDETLPMSVVRSIAYDPDRERRRQAYEAELQAWKTVEVPLAAAMNSIKGENGLLSRRRGWESILHESCFGNNMDVATLDAMMGAAEASFPAFRRYLRAKAQAIGAESLAWYDLFAPLGGEGKGWEYDEAERFVEEQFRSYSDKMGDFAARSFRERWIDAEPRSGKADGAYCMGMRGDESRILMNFKPSFGSVSTLAHELGHGYHNLCLAGRNPLQKQTPMTLAETASIFCETIVRQAVLRNGTPEEQLAVLEASLQGSTQVVVDISSRFKFESEVFARRAARELSAREMCEIMVDAQLATYGDGLDRNALHPYMWAVKGHYYGRSFYNYPYMFGLLFGLGLYAIYEQEPQGFHERYDTLLGSTGLDDAASLAEGFGIDIRSSAFWEGSLGQIEADVDRFESLIRKE